MTTDEKTIHLSLAIGLMDIVKYYENKENAKSAKSVSINNLIENTARVTDLYRINAWPPEKLATGSHCLDMIEELVRKLFNSKLVGRDDKGRFMVLA